MSQPSLDLRSRRMLLADWFARLATEAGLGLTQHGTSGDAFTFRSPEGLEVRADPVETPPHLLFTCSNPERQEVVVDLAAKAAAEVDSLNFGGEVWYSSALSEVPWTVGAPQTMGTLVQRLGTQTRILGWRRLGGAILLEFTEDAPEGSDDKTRLLAPKAVVKVHIAVPGPAVGHFSSHVAHHTLEVVGAICTFALGRPVALPPMVFPSRSDEPTVLEQKRKDRQILTLARKHVPLDIHGWIQRPGGFQVFERLRAALLTHDAAVKQEHDAVASTLYVVAAECLTVPPTPWRKERLTKRFREFYDDIIPDALDEIVAHANFEEAIGLKRGARTARALRRDTLDRIYSFRSGVLHEGLDPSYHGMGFDAESHMRRALFADFVEAAILAYAQCPRSSVIGDPVFEAEE